MEDGPDELSTISGAHRSHREYRDGTKQGFNIPLTRAVSDALTIPVIASGGVGNLDHLVEGVTEGHASAVLAASIFHFGTYTIAEAKAHMKKAGVSVRDV